MRKHRGTPSWRDKHVGPAAISPPGVARGRFVWGHQSGPAGCKPPPLFKRGASSCLSQRIRQQEPWGASPRPRAPTYLPLPLVLVGGFSPFLAEGLVLVLVGERSLASCVLVSQAGVCGRHCVVRMCFCVSCLLAAPVLVFSLGVTLLCLWRALVCVRMCVLSVSGGLRVLVPAYPGWSWRLVWAPVRGCHSQPLQTGVRWRRCWLVLAHPG